MRKQADYYYYYYEYEKEGVGILSILILGAQKLGFHGILPPDSESVVRQYMMRFGPRRRLHGEGSIRATGIICSPTSAAVVNHLPSLRRVCISMV